MSDGTLVVGPVDGTKLGFVEGGTEGIIDGTADSSGKQRPHDAS